MTVSITSSRDDTEIAEVLMIPMAKPSFQGRTTRRASLPVGDHRHSCKGRKAPASARWPAVGQPSRSCSRIVYWPWVVRI